MPVLAYTIHAALAASRITEVVVSTDDDEIGATAERWGARLIKRPAELSLDTSPIDDALRHAMTVLSAPPSAPPTVLVWLQADVPIRQAEMIDRAVLTLEDDRNATAAATGAAVVQHPAWMKSVNGGGYLVPFAPDVAAYRHQDLSPLFILDGAVVAIRPDNLNCYERPSRVHQYLGDRARLLAQPHAMYSLNIETRDQLEMAEFYLERHTEHRVGPS